jgi:hypothetical protein
MISRMSLKSKLLKQFMNILLSVGVITLLSLPTLAVAQEKPDTDKVSQEQLDKYNEIKEAAKVEKAEKAVAKDGTGNDPRAFTDKWMPLYRYTKLENGLVQQDVNAFGSLAFSDYVGMFYELPLAQYRDFSKVADYPDDLPSSAIGVGDISLKFLMRPKALDFSYGESSETNKKSGSINVWYGFRSSYSNRSFVGRKCFCIRTDTGGCDRYANVWIFRHVEPLLF